MEQPPPSQALLQHRGGAVCSNDRTASPTGKDQHVQQWAQQRRHSQPRPEGLWPRPPQRADCKLVRFGAPEAGSGFLSRVDEPFRFFLGTNNIQALLKHTAKGRLHSSISNLSVRARIQSPALKSNCINRFCLKTHRLYLK